MKYLFARPIISMAFMIGIFFSAYAQYGSMKGSNSAQIGAGFTDAGVLINGYFSRNFGTDMRGLFGAGLAYSDVKGVQHYAVYIDGIASLTLQELNKGAFKFNGQAGLSFAFDVLDTGESNLSDKSVTMNTGAVGGFEGEFTVSHNMSFALASNIRYFIKEDFGKVRFQTTLGMRFLLGR